MARRSCQWVYSCVGRLFRINITYLYEFFAFFSPFSQHCHKTYRAHLVHNINENISFIRKIKFVIMKFKKKIISKKHGDKKPYGKNNHSCLCTEKRKLMPLHSLLLKLNFIHKVWGKNISHDIPRKCKVEFEIL